MKKYFIILILIFLALQLCPEGDDKGGKIRDRMNEYIRIGLDFQKRTEKFSPVFKILPRIQTNSP
jgi:hypothetical protein